MAQRLQKQLTVFGDWEEVSLPDLASFNGKLSVSYSHATQFSFSLIAPEQTVPIERLAFVRFWIEGATLDDGVTEQDEDHPLFEGFVESVGPGGDSNKVNVTCFDPTYRIAQELTTMSAPWQAGTPDTDPDDQIPPTEGVGAVPRLIYNAKDEGDPDYADNVGGAGSIGQIIAGILEFSQEPLWWRNAAPGDIGSGSELAYDPGDLTGMTFVPQEKIVWESESVRAALARLERYEPRYRLMWEPGSRLWRFRDLTTAPEVTLRLNDPTIDFPVFSLDLTPNLDKAFTALKIYGPPTATVTEFTWYHPDVAPDGWTNTLQPVGDAQIIETIGAHDIVTYRGWQVVNSAQRRGAHELPEWTPVRCNEFIWESAKYPQFQLTWDGGESWVTCRNAFLDYLNGQAVFPATLPYATLDQQYGQTAQYVGQHYYPPNGARLIWAPYEAPLSVRVPESGFSGTAFTIAGLKNEKKLYDVQLAIGREYGIAVTSEARIEQMTLYATSLLDKSQNIVWVGGCVLDGIDYSWCRLNRSVSFEASDGSGGTTTTGWETIKAYVTDYEIDFENQTTTIQFSSDRAELIGDDPAQIKQQLHIKDLEQITYEDVSFLWRTQVNWRGEKFQELAGVQVTSGFQYVDSETGQIVETH